MADKEIKVELVLDTAKAEQQAAAFQRTLADRAAGQMRGAGGRFESSGQSSPWSGGGQPHPPAAVEAPITNLPPGISDTWSESQREEIRARAAARRANASGNLTQPGGSSHEAMTMERAAQLQVEGARQAASTDTGSAVLNPWEANRQVQERQRQHQADLDRYRTEMADDAERGRQGTQQTRNERAAAQAQAQGQAQAGRQVGAISGVATGGIQGVPGALAEFGIMGAVPALALGASLALAAGAAAKWTEAVMSAAQITTQFAQAVVGSNVPLVGSMGHFAGTAAAAGAGAVAGAGTLALAGAGFAAGGPIGAVAGAGLGYLSSTVMKPIIDAFGAGVGVVIEAVKTGLEVGIRTAWEHADLSRLMGKDVAGLAGADVMAGLEMRVWK